MNRFHLRSALGGLITAVGLTVALHGTASAATTLSLAPLTAENSTPNCPVSAAQPVCGPWNVPVDVGSVFGAVAYGQCTYWASVKYPALILDEVANDPLGVDWNAGTWAQHAAAEGLPITTTPAPGDLAVWAATASDPDGHVAYVEAVEGDAVIVSQMDGDSTAPFPALQGTTQYLDADTLAYFRSSYNLQFIDTGDHVTGTPLSYVEAPTTAAQTTTPTHAATTPAKAVTKPAAKVNKKAVKKKTVKKRTVTRRTATKRTATKRTATKKGARKPAKRSPKRRGTARTTLAHRD